MVFNSLTFIIFFLVVLIVYNLPLPWKFRKLHLIIASYLFYAAWNPPFVILLAASTVIDWSAANLMQRDAGLARRRLWLALSLVFNVGCLSFFKYGKFLLENWQGVMSAIGVHFQPPAWSIVLPVGISFYTFQSMSYTLDIYLGRDTPVKSFLDFTLFVTFFPQLVAGPISRPHELAPQFAKPPNPTAEQLLWGLALMTFGLFEKVVLADGILSKPVEAVYGATAPLGFLDAWIGTLAFSGQIFCDFAGYSTVAIGCALCLGFSLPDNFNCPYAALGFSDFWRRWHITLSQWFRDYVFLPLELAGRRIRKPAVRVSINLLLMMLLCGLWHGARWTFIAWGGLHGLFLAVERLVRGRKFRGDPLTQSARFGLGLLTFVLVSIAWVFFRSTTFAQAGAILAGMAGLHATAAPLVPTIYIIETAVILALVLLCQWLARNSSLEQLAEKVPTLVFATAWAVLLLAVIVTQGGGESFIYFQF